MFWRIIDIAIINSRLVFRVNNPESKIQSQRDFGLELVRQLVQPLLNQKASPDCPSILQSHKGRKVVSSDKCLLGKHFPCKAEQRGRCCVCGKQKSATGKWLDIKTRTYCPKCEVLICLGNYFQQYHTKSKSLWVYFAMSLFLSLSLCLLFWWEATPNHPDCIDVW